MEQNASRTLKKKRSFKQVDQYYIDTNSIIGESYLSKVYRACSSDNLNQIYACKVIDKKDIYQFDELKKLVERWREFDHPNLIKVYDCFMTSHNVYLIMEYCNGGYLFHNEQSWNLKQILQYYKQIIEGSLYLSKQLVIDQILTPENILFHNGVPKIDISVQYEDYELLKRSYIPQRYKYMSPQVIEEVDHTNKCNVWSLGIIIYEQFQQRDPFEHQFTNLIQRLHTIIKTENIQFFEHNHLSDDIKKMIISMLKYEEKDRPSMEEVLSKVNLLIEQTK